MAENKLGLFDCSFHHQWQSSQVLDLIAGENRTSELHRLLRHFRGRDGVIVVAPHYNRRV